MEYLCNNLVNLVLVLADPVLVESGVGGKQLTADGLGADGREVDSGCGEDAGDTWRETSDTHDDEERNGGEGGWWMVYRLCNKCFLGHL